MAKAKSNFSFDVIKKNLFWFFVPLAILLVWGIFFVADSKAKAALSARIAELDGIKKNTEGTANNSEHPNQGTIDDAKAKAEQLRIIVLDAWKEMYEVQKDNRVWSEKLDASFTAYVSKLKWLSPIPDVQRREWYNQFIAEQIPDFLVKIQRRTVYVRVPDPNKPDTWKKDAEGNDLYLPIDPYVATPDEMMLQNAKLISSGTSMMGGMGGGMGSMGGGGMGGGTGSGFTSFSSAGGGMGGGSPGGMMSGGRGGDGGMDMAALSSTATSMGTSLDSIFDLPNQKVEGIVDWPNPEIFTIVTWSGQSPFSGQIWYAQEEVWVYDSLIDVVRKINKQVNATGPHNAAIKRIQAMLIGKNAAGIVSSPGLLEPLSPASSMGGMSGMGMDGMGPPSDSMGTGASGMDMVGGMSSGPLNEEDTMAYLKKFRYVGEDLKPLSDSDPAPFAEFNMMPVCLELIVDQRKIPDILVECANSTMPIDIKLVRYNPANARTGLIKSAMGGGGMGGEGGMGDMGMGPPGGMGGGTMGGGAMGGPGGLGANAGMDTAAEALSGFEVGGKIGAYGSDAVMIQVVGIIYLYNEPDETLLGTGASSQESTTEGDGTNPDESNQNSGVDSTSTLPTTPAVPAGDTTETSP